MIGCSVMDGFILIVWKSQTNKNQLIEFIKEWDWHIMYKIGLDFSWQPPSIDPLIRYD